MKKKILLLGGSRYIVPVVKTAQSLGVSVITADYLPNNVAHKYSDQYVNVSIVDKKKVLELAKAEKIDGIMSFAADPGVLTAAYVAERLNLPFQCSYESAQILQNKERFRNFLRSNNFACPKSTCIKSSDELNGIKNKLDYPIIVKPTDSAGSKGVSKVSAYRELHLAVEGAIKESFSGKCIIEEFIEKSGDSSDSDCFSVDGRFECVSFTNQLFENESEICFTPSAYTLPNKYKDFQKKEIKLELQRISDLLGLRSGIYNVETRVDKRGVPYIMELSPRGGGNRLAELLKYATGVDLIKESVEASLGLPISRMNELVYDGYWAEIMLHSEIEGVFKDVRIKNNAIGGDIVDMQVWINPGEKIYPFTSANFAFGSLILRFATAEEMQYAIQNKNNWLEIEYW